MEPTTGKLVLIGGGGHALVVAEAAELGGWELWGCYDDADTPRLASGFPHARHLGRLADATGGFEHAWIVAMGEIGDRRRWLDRLTGAEPAAAVVIHPWAVVSPSAKLGAGVFVGPAAVVHTRATVGAHAIVNTAAVIEHECDVGANSHIGPGAVLAGSVRVGDDTLVGMGALVMPGVTIGRGCVIGAGAVVRRPVADGARVAGVPARVL